MARANELAARGWGRVHPNPLVGAIVVRDGVEVGNGWHAEFGGLHAEAVALHEAGPLAHGSTLYVTLEPCTHHGKQPPCVDAILAAGIRRVVIAVSDPNPAAGGGADLLRARGVVVDVGVHGDEVRRLNQRFLRQFDPTERPFVAVKLAVSMDGMIADATGNSRWVSSASAREWVQWLRAGFDAVGVGAATAIADGSRLTARGAAQPRMAPRRVVFDRSGRIAADHPVFTAAEDAAIVVVDEAHGSQVRRALQDSNADVIVSNELGDSLNQVHALGIDSILIEGGGRLAGRMLADGLIDRIYQIQCPVWLGDGLPAWAGLGQVSIETAPRWRVVDRVSFDVTGEVMLELER